MDKTARVKELINILNDASKAYYSGDAEVMSNFEYDALYDELEALEKETGIVFANSPTQNVGYEAADELVKERHIKPMLSLDKTKEPEVLAEFLGSQKGLLSWKLDGLTVVLTYENGELSKAVTRGNGEIGEVVTANARAFVNLPVTIPYKGKLVLRGEAVIRYSDFEKINESLKDAESRYKNPRNLCSGAVRQLDPKITAQRKVNFIAFSLESVQDSNDDGTVPADAGKQKTPDFKNSNEEKFKWLKSQGFDVVSYKVVTGSTIKNAVKEYSEEIKSFDIPSDGLVILMDDIEYGQSLGTTAKFPRNSMAFKWKDEIAQTTLREIEWSPSRTGLINPVAVFDPVELEGTTVSRASVHNVSIIEGLQLGIGDTITVYKANMIIPQIAENLTKSGSLEIAGKCPACHGKTAVNDENGVKTLICPNEDCPAKHIGAFANYVSRNCMNIDGISEETLEKFISRGLIEDFSDLYHLDRYKNVIINMEGFGEKSYGNIIASVDVSRKTTCARLLNALGVPNVGRTNAAMISRYFDNDFMKVMNAGKDELLQIDGVGEVIADSLTAYFADDRNQAVIAKILAEITFEDEASQTESTLVGLTFVITGSLDTYRNRDALKAEIEAAGGKVSGSVSSKTSFLINNDIMSQSGKNKTAKQLGIPIITEQEYIDRFAAKVPGGGRE